VQPVTQLGSHSLEGIEPLAATGVEPMPHVENVAPRPKEAFVSDEQRAAVMKRARAEQYHFEADEASGGTVSGSNPAQGMDLQYGGEGLVITPRQAKRTLADPEPVAPAWSIQLRCRSLAAGPAAVYFEDPGRPAAEEARVSALLAPGCREWYVNREDGLEHGFTIEEPAGAGERAEVTLAIEVRTGLSVEAGREQVIFRKANGRAVAAYRELHVFDGTGRELASSMMWREGDESGAMPRIELSADVRGAQYPLVVDPVMVSTNEEIKASDEASGDQYGAASDGCGDVLAVGAPANGGGKVYIYVEDHGGRGEWNEKTTAVIPAGENPRATDRFGAAVAVFKNEVSGAHYLAVTAPEYGGTGAVFIYERNRGGPCNWGFVEKIQPNDLSAGDLFGCSVDGQGNQVVIGAKAQGAGAVYIFDEASGRFTQSQKIQTPGPSAAGDEFGAAVAVGGNGLVIGAPGENSEVGGAYLFEKGSPFRVLFRLFAEPGKAEAGMRFGAVVAIAITGLLLAVSAPHDQVNLGGRLETNVGSVFIYAVLATGLWGFLTALFGTEAGGLFGSSLALNFLHDLVVGSSGATSRPGVVAGAVFLFLFLPLLLAFDSAQKIVPSPLWFLDAGMGFGTTVVLLGLTLFAAGVAYSFFKGAMFRLTLVATVLTWAIWQLLHFTPKMISDFPQRTNKLGDWDGDGLPNFVEFAMFLIPVIFNANPFRGPLGPGAG